jgi:hypothetical protein
VYVGARSTAHRRYQRNLVAVSQRVPGRDVLAIDRHDDLAPLHDRAEARVTGDGVDEVAGGRAVGQLDVELVTARRLTQHREQTHGDNHAIDAK